MLAWLIDASAKNRALVLFAAAALAIAGFAALHKVKLDAIPDLSDPQANRIRLQWPARDVFSFFQRILLRHCPVLIFVLVLRRDAI